MKPNEVLSSHIALPYQQTKNLKSPDLKRICCTGLDFLGYMDHIYRIYACKWIVTSYLICNVHGLSGQDKWCIEIVKVGVYTDNTGNWSKTKYISLCKYAGNIKHEHISAVKQSHPVFVYIICVYCVYLLCVYINSLTQSIYFENICMHLRVYIYINIIYII